MTYWTKSNTDGFTDEELNNLNSAQDELQEKFPDVDASNIADALNNAWVECASAAYLVGKIDERWS